MESQLVIAAVAHDRDVIKAQVCVACVGVVAAEIAPIRVGASGGAAVGYRQMMHAARAEEAGVDGPHVVDANVASAAAEHLVEMRRIAAVDGIGIAQVMNEEPRAP